jgi:hypothetical protein
MPFFSRREYPTHILAQHIVDVLADIRNDKPKGRPVVGCDHGFVSACCRMTGEETANCLAQSGKQESAPHLLVALRQLGLGPISHLDQLSNGSVVRHGIRGRWWHSR